MEMELISSMQVIESLMDVSAAAAGQLDTLMEIESPIKPMALASDCCGSNNYQK